MSQAITLSSLIPVVSEEILGCDFGVVTLELVMQDHKIVRWAVGRQKRSHIPAPTVSAPDPRDNV